MNNVEVSFKDLNEAVEIYEKVQDYLDHIFEGCIAGTYIITKISGSNNSKYEAGYSFTGISRGIKEGYSMFLESPNEFFRTSIVKDVKWETKYAGVFHTLNSTYEFIYYGQ